MPQWLMKFEVEAHMGVRADLKSVRFKHPNLNYEIILQNHDMRPGIETPLMFAYVHVEAEDIDEASERGDEILGNFLDILGFSTGARYRLHRRIGIYDWSPGISSREGRVYTSILDPNKPWLILDEAIAPAVETFQLAAQGEIIRRALRWFRGAVSAVEPDIQFQWFWFVIETLAGASTDKPKVPDRCPHCREPLFCRKCTEVSTHRPYPSQAIEQLFKKHVSDEPEKAFQEASAMRHALLHGGSTNEVETKYDTTLSQLVNRVGKVAWVALLDGLSRAKDPSGKNIELHLTQPAEFSHFALHAFANVSIGLAKDRDLTIDDFPNPTLKIIVE